MQAVFYFLSAAEKPILLFKTLKLADFGTHMMVTHLIEGEDF